MKPSKGLATWAGLVAALGQYMAAVAVFLEADDQSVALGPLVTATVTLLAVVVGRMQQAKALAAKPAPVSFTTPMTSSAANLISGAIGGNVGLGYTTPTGQAAVSEEMGDEDALPDYQTETDPPPDEGDTSANGDAGERPA